MSKYMLLSPAGTMIALALCAGSATAADVRGSQDYPLVGRYAGSDITVYKQSQFGEVRLLDRPMNLKASGDKLAGVSLTLQGKITTIRYDGPKDRSALEIEQNFKSSLETKGFEILFECGNQACLDGENSYFRLGGELEGAMVNSRFGLGVRYVLAKLARAEGDVYAAILVGESRSAPIISVTTAELKPIQVDRIVFLDAGAMASGLGASGRVALYGIFFDTDKSDLKPESKPTLVEIAKLLAAQPGRKLIVAGHTDNQGEFAYNVALSDRRAKAVVTALTRDHGVDPSRLTPFGAGMSSPVALNDDDAGRAKNRRVELVER